MIQPLIDALNEVSPLNNEDVRILHELGQSCSIVELKRGDYLFKEGDIPGIEVFVVTGMLRKFVRDPRQNERITQFFSEKEFIYDCGSYVNKVPIDYSIQAIEPCTLISVDLESTFAFEQKFPSFELIGLKMMEAFIRNQQEHITLLLKYTPEERYQYILQQKPDWIRRISVTHLAQFLGLSRETLSRFRGRPLESVIL